MGDGERLCDVGPHSDATDAERLHDYQIASRERHQEHTSSTEMYRFGKGESEFQFTIMSRAKGVPLMAIWEGLPADVKKGYAQQMIATLRELRQFTSPVPCRVDGSTLWDNIIGQCSPGTCKTIGKTKEEWFDGMSAELRYGLSKRLQTEDKNIIDAALQDIIDKFPDNAPYVLTHGDLIMGNIIVNEGKIEAIIDWKLPATIAGGSSAGRRGNVPATARSNCSTRFGRSSILISTTTNSEQRSRCVLALPLRRGAPVILRTPSPTKFECARRTANVSRTQA